LAKTWVENGHEVHVLTPHSFNSLAFEQLGGMYVHRFHYFFRDKWETLTYGDGIPQNIRRFKNKLLVPFLGLSFWWHAVWLVRKYQIEIVNAHWAVPMGYIGLWIRRVTRTKLVITVYGAELFPVMAGRMKLLKPFIARAVNQADIVAGISQATVQAAQALSGRADIPVIPDGIDTTYYQPGSKNVELLKKYNCTGKKVVFFTGRMVERKGHRYLLEAMKEVQQEIPGAKLILGGKGVLFQDLIRLREALHLQDVIEMPGFIPEDELTALLQSVNLYVLPSCVDSVGDTEGSATAALEAMACGVPAIISYAGGNMGAIREDEGAYYCRPNDASDLADKIIHLLNQSDEEWQETSSRARNYVITHYNWNTIIKRYKELIEAV
jgi:glycosyltransferase involved in cell wall biosynthesis